MNSYENAPFYGISTAIITPFRSGGSLDIDSFENLIKKQKAAGIGTLTVAGTTGEAPTISEEEHHTLIACAVSLAGDSMHINAGVGSNDTQKAVRLARSAYNAGADSLLAVTPYYNKANASGLCDYFLRIADATPLPLILYNVPSRTGMSIPFSVYRELLRCERIVGLKDASGDISFAVRFMHEYGDRLALYCGNDDITLPYLSIGASGAISVASNIIPREMNEIYEYVKWGRTDAARERHISLSPVFSALSSDVNPIPVKGALSLLGMAENILRSPLSPASGEKLDQIKGALSKCNAL